MRITGGDQRGRVIVAPDTDATRPTADRVREALFNIIAHHDWGDAIGDPLDGTIVLDAYAGSGALGLDALSRGAAHAYFMDKARAAQTAIRQNAATLHLSSQTTILPMDVLHAPRAARACTLLFLDPPYRKDLIVPSLAALDAAGWIAPHALIVAETAKNEKPPTAPGFALLDERTYGDTAVYFMTPSQR